MEEHSGRSFSEEQVRAIISGAIRRQEAARKVADTDGLTLEEIRRLAAEVGIDPKYVVAAASELEGEDEEALAARLLGGPLKVSYERFVEGSLSEEGIAAMVREIRSTLRQYRGNLEVLGASFDWVPPPNAGEDLLIQAQSEDGHTRIYISQKFAGWAILSYFLLMVPLIVGILLTVTAPSSMAFAALAGLMALVLVSRFTFGMVTRKRSEKLRKLADRLEAIAAEHAVPSEIAAREAAPTRAAAPSPPLLDLDGPSEREDERSPAQRRRDVSGRRD
jgi:TM2 domain-containing membrane protein YozV